MFKTNQSHTFFNEDKVPSKNGAVILYKTQPKAEKNQPGKFIVGTFMALSLVTLSLQSGWVYNASAQGAPITSPVTSEESPSPSASATPLPSQSPSGNPITSPEVSPSPKASNNPSSGGNSGGGNSSSNSGGSVGAPSCETQAPKSAPKILSAITTGKNEITLTWEKAQDPVTNYVIAYGLQKGKPLYGNPNVGNVTKYKVSGLSGGFTYYFKVRAGNDCKPGEFSNEIGVKVGGKFINSPAQEFKSGVLGKSIKKNNVNWVYKSPAPVASVTVVSVKPQAQNNGGLAGKVFNFIKGLFN